MKKFQKILYYLRLTLFIVSLILIFLTIKNYIKVGIWGYIFFIMEFLFIISILFTILSKRQTYVDDLSFNIMHIGTYIYQMIVTIRMQTYELTSIIPESYIFYRNNYIIISILLGALIFFTGLLYNDQYNKKDC